MRRILPCTLLLTVAFAAAPILSADMLFTGSGVTETDNSVNFPVAGSALFSIVGDTLTMTITNTTSDPFFDSQNITALSFQVYNGSSYLTTSGSTTTTDSSTSLLNTGGSANISTGTASNGAVTPTTGSVSWQVSNLSTLTGHSLGAGNETGGMNNVDLGTNAFVVYDATSQTNMISLGGPTTFAAVNSIVGAPNGSGAYDGLPGNCDGGTGPNECNSGSPLVTKVNGLTVDQSKMIDQSVTFSFTITGLTSADTIQNVWLAYGPDGPDEDDWLSLSTEVTTPEPVSMLLCGAGLAALAARKYWTRKRA